VEAQVETIRSRGLYAGVHPAFLEEEPRIADCIRAATGSRVVVVPFFMSDGLHVVEDIPVLLGEPREQVESRHRAGQPTWQNPANRNGKQVWYAGAVGSHPSIVNLIEQRALDAVGAVPAASTERATATVGGETALPPGQGG
jgi:sirohydrochlorin cobaltochelatase